MPWDLFTKKHMAAWAISILVLMNLLVISSFWAIHLTRPPLPPVVQEPNQIAPEIPDILPFIGRELGLSRDQMRQLHEMREQALPEIRSKWLEMQKLRRDVHAHLFRSDTDPNEIRDWARRIGALQADIEWTKYEHLFAVQSICNARQRARLQLLLEDAMRLARPPGRPGGRGGPGRGFSGGRGTGRGPGGRRGAERDREPNTQ
jgi:hypothetical protein